MRDLAIAALGVGLLVAAVMLGPGWGAGGIVMGVSGLGIACDRVLRLGARVVHRIWPD